MRQPARQWSVVVAFLVLTVVLAAGPASNEEETKQLVAF